ncbi:MAG: 3-deoxy-D-manno-octulosonic acid transferase [Thermodesulfobacteriota bacterium]
MILRLYQTLTTLAGLLGWPYFYWHLKHRGRGESFLPRLGIKLPPPPPPGRPRIWLHGVSVGEILAAQPLFQELKRLLPQAGFIITTGTETGQAVARKNYTSQGAQVCYFPLDLPWAVARYLDHLRPDLFVALDSEIWPNFLTQARSRGVRLALVNARLSDASFGRYVKYRRYLIDILNNIELLSAGSQQDYERFRSLGLPPGKLHLTGNLKIDRLLESQKTDNMEEFRFLMQGTEEPATAPVFLAASTHPGEEEAVLEAYQNLRSPYPALLLLLAPRHPERTPELGRLLNSRGLPLQLWSRLKSGQESRRASVVLIDTVGDLFSLYGLADVAFVGGSLVPHGGQNLLEPAAWGLVPIYGPHINNFRWAQAILESAQAGIMIQDAPSLTAALRDLLDHPDQARVQGQRARDALTPHQGAARRQAELILRLCEVRGQLK